MKTINRLYEEKEIDEIRQKGEEHERLCWWFGDQAIEAYKRQRKLKGEILNSDSKWNHLSGKEEIKILSETQQDIFDQLGVEAKKSGRTIRHYYDLARFFVGSTREIYDPLPLSHFEFAITFPKFAEQILEFSLRAMDGNGGKPRSKNYLIANLSKVINDEELLKELGLVQDVEDSVSYADYHEVVDQQPEEQERIHPIAFHFLQRFKKTTDFWKRGIEKWKIPEDRKSEILSDIQELEEKIGLLAGIEKQET